MTKTPHVICRDAPLRIVLVGAESCGKTTLAKQLAGHYQSWWVPEYWRYYWEARHLASSAALTSEEFIHVAEMQILIERHYGKKSETLIFIDTDTFMTSIWHYRYQRHDSPILESIWKKSHRDLVLFCTDEIPFVQDGTRDGEMIRSEMNRWIEEKLMQESVPYIKISGSIGERFTVAKNSIDELFHRRAIPSQGSAS